MLDFLFVVFLLTGFVISFAYFLNWYYASRSRQNSTHFIITQDGWKIAIHHYRPETNSGSVPVILCHGLASNRFIFDMEGAPSLACYLRDNGFDVWVPELRGSGLSDTPGLFRSASPYRWGFGHHLDFDVPAIIDFVTEKTGSPKAIWIGHSMGGMLIYSHLAKNHDARISSVVTIGSPVAFDKNQRHIFKGALKLKFALKFCPVNPLPFFGRLLVPVITKGANFVHGMYCRTNMDPRVARCVSTVASQLISPSMLWLDLAGFIESGQFKSSDGVPILKKVENLDIPVYVIAGSRDEVAPMDWVVPAARSNDEHRTRRLLVAGRENGFEQDYGHVDMLVGLKAQTELYPTIRSWLQQF